MSTAEKRVLETPKSWAEKSVVILDIEGTTTAISFVKDTLFPYVRTNVEKYIKEHWTDDDFKTVLAQLIEQSEKDAADKVEGVVELKKDEADDEKAQKAVVANVLWQMDGDRKTKALKLLQGHIYREGYKNGDLKGHVFSDVAGTLKKWKEADKEIYIYSSGSVEAQKLLFGNSTEGDLLKFLSGHFDTEVGAKQESMSYKNILEKIKKTPEELVFFTDVFKEAEAAKEAGIMAVLVEREGNAKLSSEEQTKYPVVKSLDFFEVEEDGAGPVKRMKVDAEEDIEMKEAEPEKKEENEEKSTTEEMQTEASEEKTEKIATDEVAAAKEDASAEEGVKAEEGAKVEEDAKVEEGAKAEEGAKVEEGAKAEEGATPIEEPPAAVEKPAAKETETEKKADDLPKSEGESPSDPEENSKEKSTETAVVEENKTVEALEAPPKVEAIEHKPDAVESEDSKVIESDKAVEPTTNGTTHENGTIVNGKETNGVATNGVSKETNGSTKDIEECQANGKPEDEAGEKVSPVKKVVTESAADGKEATECAE